MFCVFICHILERKIVIIITRKNFANYERKALTKNGNEYRPSRFGMCAGMLAGTLVSGKILTSNSFAKEAESCAKKIWATKSLKNCLKGVCKTAGFGIKASAIAAATIIAGALLGNTLFDAPMNQELRDQADGEAIRKK